MRWRRRGCVSAGGPSGSRRLAWSGPSGGRAALELYRRYQQCLNPGAGPWYQFTIGDTRLNVSLFLADTRSQRDPFGTPAGAHFVQPPQ